ncbi:MAG TPA: anhydro-N-acetylmuramic acid kinase, partial [Thermoanaerobaculia bacterium]|nr:anhydro-N-acetylmuramic acid kinase [Thermoanaerobaculia bacterium]
MDGSPGAKSVDRLLGILRKPRHRVIGLMSGTSVDAIDAALVEISGTTPHTVVELRAFTSLPFPPEIRRRLFQLFDPARGRVDTICNLDFLMGEVFAEAAMRLMREAKLDPSEIDLIGSAGQTLWHDPEPITLDAEVDWIERPIVTRSTFAIGQSAVIAERTGVVTIGDLRVRDVAAGGQGAPLVSYADWVLLRDARRGRCVQNIGGIGNVTYVPPNSSWDAVVAFDTGPGNMIIDELVFLLTDAVETYDKDGRRAARGTVREEVLAWCLENQYY